MPRISLYPRPELRLDALLSEVVGTFALVFAATVRSWSTICRAARWLPTSASLPRPAGGGGDDLRGRRHLRRPLQPGGNHRLLERRPSGHTAGGALPDQRLGRNRALLASLALWLLLPDDSRAMMGVPRAGDAVWRGGGNGGDPDLLRDARDARDAQAWQTSRRAQLRPVGGCDGNRQPSSGLAVGTVVALEIWFAGPTSGSSMNPSARSPWRCSRAQRRCGT